MFSAETFIRQIGETEHGAPRLDAIANAIREADNASAHAWRFYFRFEAIRESIFFDDAFKAIISFPEMLKIYDDHPELEDDYADDMLCAFKWVLENMREFYQIPRADIERTFDEYERRCKQYGVSMRIFHMKKTRWLLETDREAARREYEAFHREKRDGYCDCEACETNFDMFMSLEFGDEEEALRIAKPLLDHSLHCAEVPHVTYARLAEYYLYHGDLGEAAYYGELCERLTHGDPEFLGPTGTLLALYSAVDPNHGWNLLKQCIPHYLACRNPLMRMRFAEGAYRMMTVLGSDPDAPPKSKAPVLRTLPVPADDEGVEIAAVRDYFYQIAHEMARNLDERNGSDYFKNRLSREIVPVTKDAAALETAPRAAHGIVRKTPAVLIASLPEGVEVTLEQMAERVRAIVPVDAELISCTVDEDGLFISYRRDKRVFDYAVAIARTPEAPPCNAVADLTDEALEKLLANPVRYVLRADLGDPTQLHYHYVMELFCTMLPELGCVVDVMNQHAYSAAWVRFKGTYDSSVTPNDLFGLYLTGDSNTGEIWMTTTGLCTLGMRELEIIGADQHNYGILADILDHLAAQAVERGVLPDEGEPFGRIFIGEDAYPIKWALLPDKDALGDSLAGKIERSAPTGMLLIQNGDHNELLSQSDLIANAEELDYPHSNRNFHRRLALAKESFGLFERTLQKPFTRAAVQMEFRLSDEMREKYDYGIELLWCEVVSVEDGEIRVEVQETSECLPEVHAGDIITAAAERAAVWFIQPEGADGPISMQDGYLLDEEANK